MGIITLNSDGSQDQLTLPGLDAPGLYWRAEAAKRVRYILCRFQDTFQTESAMYLEFCRLPEADRSFLAAYWRHEGAWETFLHLCRYFNVTAA